VLRRAARRGRIILHRAVCEPKERQDRLGAGGGSCEKSYLASITQRPCHKIGKREGFLGGSSPSPPNRERNHGKKKSEGGPAEALVYHCLKQGKNINKTREHREIRALWASAMTKGEKPAGIQRESLDRNQTSQRGGAEKVVTITIGEPKMAAAAWVYSSSREGSRCRKDKKKD